VVGGILIAVASTISMRTYEKVTGVSEIFNSMIRFDKPVKDPKSLWQFCFFVGLITCPNVIQWIFGNSIQIGKTSFAFFDSNVFTIEQLSIAGWIIGGTLVGTGSRMTSEYTKQIFSVSQYSLGPIITFLICAMGMATLRHKLPFLTLGPDVSAEFY